LGEDELDGINKGRFKIPKGERGRMGVSTNFSANVNRRQMTKSVDVHIMVDVRMERGNKGDRISLKIGDMGEKAKEVSFYVLFLRNPILFSAVVDNSVLVWMTINSKSTNGGVEEMGEKVSYRLFA